MYDCTIARHVVWPDLIAVWISTMLASSIWNPVSGALASSHASMAIRLNNARRPERQRNRSCTLLKRFVMFHPPGMELVGLHELKQYTCQQFDNVRNVGCRA